jgi:Protein of unknown function (DUF1549)/Protein of unknown function (DUF1553)
MKTTPVSLTAAVFLSSTALAAEKMTPAAETPEVLPVAGEVASLKLEPAELKLTGPTGYLQVLATATMKDGTVADATRAVKWEAEIVEISPAGVLVPKGDGAGKLRAVLGGVSVEAPVTVSGTAGEFVPDYIRDVTPIISRIGCNAGTCHGAKEGKAGFKLSLRGYDPIFDIRAFTDDIKGRRTNVASADESLMLLKGTAGVPHEGGQVMKPGDKYYNIIRAWIAGGMKLDLQTPRVAKIELSPVNPVLQIIGSRQQFRVVATYADGMKRDVTQESYIESGNTDIAKHDKTGLLAAARRGEAPVLARYEGAYASTVLTVMGDRTGFVWQQPPANNRIDELVAAKLQRMKTLQSPLCTDLEFVRRVYLDLTGLPPSPEAVTAFIDDPRDSRWKRDELTDRLIASEEFNDHWTNKWCDLLQVNSKFLGGEGAQLFREWIRGQVKANAPYDQFARAILTASGSNKEVPAASYFKVLRAPAETMENTTHLFLATRFNCNKCHDHPFERWTQDQYYEMAAWFAQTALERDPASGDRKLGGTDVESAKPLFEKVLNRSEGEVKHERTGKVTAPAFPYSAKFQKPEKAARRDELAAWITTPDNQYFASSYVNRIWGYLTGVGIIEPLDDIRAGNPPGNPELLKWLTQDFIAHGFDTRRLIRTICQSRTYQLSLQTNKWNEDDNVNYSHAIARRLPAEVLYDAIFAVTGAKSILPGNLRAAQMADSQAGTPDGFLNNLGKPARESACECERQSDLQLGPIMALISGPTVGDAVSAPGNALAQLVETINDDAELVRGIFMRVLNRPPSGEETRAAAAVVAEMEPEHAKLEAEHKAVEEKMKPVVEQRENDRLAAIAANKAELEKYETELAPRMAEAEKQRQEKIAAAQKAVADAEAALAAKLPAWEAQQAKGQTGWTILDPASAVSTQKKNKLEKQPDLSVFVTGPDGKQDYTITAKLTSLPVITGLRLEAMTDSRIPANGPGRSGGGNFVVSELEAVWTPVAGPGKESIEPRTIVFGEALATYSQGGYEVAKAVNGQVGPEPDGWAIYADGIGKPQTAVFTCKEPLSTGGAEGEIKVVIKQKYPDGKHSLGRFRLSLTGSSAPLNFGLPVNVVEALAAAPDKRTPEQTKALLDHLRQSDADIQAKEKALAEANKPLPPDAQREALKAKLAKTEAPLPVDPLLATFRRDVELSRAQLQNKRLTAAQDLAWALINNPAFLFNH